VYGASPEPKAWAVKAKKIRNARFKSLLVDVNASLREGNSAFNSGNAPR
jgi:hypothetical protein